MTARSLVALVALVPLVALSSGCFRTTVYSGLPPAEPAEGYSERWHSGWLGGAIEASGPHDLTEACPAGWSMIETQTDASQGLVTLITLGIYAPQTVTIVCARAPSKEPRQPPALKPF